jgi:hypothetical protein
VPDFQVTKRFLRQKDLQHTSVPFQPKWHCLPYPDLVIELKKIAVFIVFYEVWYQLPRLPKPTEVGLNLNSI